MRRLVCFLGYEVLYAVFYALLWFGYLIFGQVLRFLSILCTRSHVLLKEVVLNGDTVLVFIKNIY